MRSLNTQTREGGIFAKIVFARFAPSRNARRSNSANLRFECFTPLATKPSAQLYGGFVTILSADLDGDRKSIPASPKPRSKRSELRTGWPVSSKTRDMVPSPQALSHMSPSNFSLSMRANVAHRGVGKKSGPFRSANRFIVGLKPPLRLYVASDIDSISCRKH